MGMKNSTRIGLLVMAVWVTAWGAREAATAPICPANGKIESPGPCELDADRTTPITISAHDVTLDCKGHAITGRFGPNAVGRGIFAKNVYNVTIKGCTVTNWNVGISLNGGAYFVEDVELHDNKYGLTLTYTNNVRVADSSIHVNDYGIYLTRALNTTVVDTEIHNNTRTGIYIYEGADGLWLGASFNQWSEISGNGRDPRDRFGMPEDTPEAAGIFIAHGTHDVNIGATSFTHNGKANNSKATCGFACHMEGQAVPVVDRGRNICTPMPATQRCPR
jgi:parallel beta-helix repeat protein